MKGYVKESIKRVKKQNASFKKEEKLRIKQLELERGYTAKEVEKKYGKAVTLFKQKNYVEAKIEFEEVEEMFPDHKATRSYIMIINQEIGYFQEFIFYYPGDLVGKPQVLTTKGAVGIRFIRIIHDASCTCIEG